MGQFAALLAKSSLVIVNEGGFLHVAVGLGILTVSFFGPQNEAIYGPYPKQGHVVVSKKIACRSRYRRFRVAQCSHHNCLKTLSVDDVLAQIQEL